MAADVPTIKAPFVGTDGRPTIEPGAFFLDGNYALRVNSWNSLAGVVITVRARLIRASDGELVDSSWDHVPNTNRTKATNDFPLPSGFVLNITAFASQGAPLIGQTFVQIQLARGLTGATLLQATMLQDYVTAVQALAYPGSPIRSSIDGGGYVRTIVGTSPPANADLSETVPTGARWEIVSIRYTLATSAVVGNRGQLLYFGLAGIPYAYAISTALFGPSLTVGFGYGQGQPVGVDGFTQVYNAPLPIANRLLAGMTFNSVTNNIKAGDQLSSPFYIVNEWLEAAA